MASRMLRRSGIAVCLFTEWLDWKPDVVFQVGIGVYWEEVRVMEEAWPGIRLVGFEPHPDLVEGLRKSYPGELHECAISDHTGTESFYCKPRHKDGSSLFPYPLREDRGECTEVKVPVTALDVLFPEPSEYGEHILLWLDCEGSELAALKGGINFLESVEIINVEMTSKPPSDEWCSPVEIHHWLMEHGFFRQHVHTQRSASGQCDCIYVRRSLFKPDYCCCPCSVEKFYNA